MKFIRSKERGQIGIRSVIETQKKKIHIHASQRRHVNIIKCLEYDDGRRTDVGVEMKRISKIFFENLFISQSGVSRRDHILFGVERCISEEDNIIFTSVYTEEEVVMVLKDMGPIKAPGMNDFPTIFFQQCWHIVGKDFSDFLLGILNNGWNLESMNITNIVLLPKVLNPTSIENFRPISLCNVIYKVIAKIVANHF